MEKLDRPKVVVGINVKVVTGCGNMYVQLGWWNGGLHEVFATLGRAGGCAMCFDSSLTRMVTLGLRCGVPVEEITKQLKGNGCPNPHPFPKTEENLSCPDAIGRVIEKYTSFTMEDLIELAMKLDDSEDGTLDEEKTLALERTEELRKERERMGL